MQVREELIAEYRASLLAGQGLAPEGERSLYTLHLAELKSLEELLDRSASPEAIFKFISTERRSFGWSYLSGAHGEQVEKRFHALASEIESQGSRG